MKNENDENELKSNGALCLYAILKVLREMLQVLRNMLHALTMRVTAKPNDFPYYSSHEIMRVFDISSSSMYRLSHEGFLIPIRIHNRTFFKKDDVYEMLDRVAAESNSPEGKWDKLNAALKQFRLHTKRVDALAEKDVTEQG